jgi:hypothetical protein
MNLYRILKRIFGKPDFTEQQLQESKEWYEAIHEFNEQKYSAVRCRKIVGHEHEMLYQAEIDLWMLLEMKYQGYVIFLDKPQAKAWLNRNFDSELAEVYWTGGLIENEQTRKFDKLFGL